MSPCDDVQTEKCQCFPSLLLPFIISSFPSSFRVPIFLPVQHVFAALLADGPTDVTVGCLVRLSRSGPEQDVLKKQIAIKFALNIHSPKRMIPNDFGDPLTSRPPGQNCHLYTRNIKI